MNACLAMLAASTVAACRPSPSKDDTGPADPAPMTVDLTGAVGLVQLHYDTVFYRQMADASLEALLPDDAVLSLANPTTTATHAYVPLSEPLWVQGDGGGTWCTLLEFSTDQGTPPVHCLSRTVESDESVPSVSGETMAGITAYGERDVWVEWRMEPVENQISYELWAYRDGVGVFVKVDKEGFGFAIDGGYASGRDIWSLGDDGVPVMASVDYGPTQERWGPYQMDELGYQLFHWPEGRIDLRGAMKGDSYCAQYLSDSSQSMTTDGPNLLVNIGTQWDGPPDVPLTYCRCSLDLDCELVSASDRAEFDLAGPGSFVSPTSTEGVAYSSGSSLWFLHDGQMSHDFALEFDPKESFAHWGEDLYFARYNGGDVVPLYRVDWKGDDAVVTETPTYELNVEWMARLHEPPG